MIPRPQEEKPSMLEQYNERQLKVLDHHAKTKQLMM
jgi:hypothetical protein